MTTDPADSVRRPESTETDALPLARRAAFAVAFAVSAVTAVRLLAVVAVGNLDAVEPLGFGRLVTAGTVGAVGGTVVYAVLDRLVADANRLFTRIAAVVLVLSFAPLVAVGPSLPGVTPVALLLLALAHSLVAVGVVTALTGRLGPLAR